MLAYSLHSQVAGSYIAFTLPSLVAKLKARMEVTTLTKAEQLELIAIIWMLTDGRPQGFIPGYQYSLQCCVIDGSHKNKADHGRTPGEWYRATLCTARSSEMDHCCQERVCEHNTVLGITCEVHGNQDCGFRCLQGNCKPAEEKPQG